jgi:hypothetical protein
MPLDAGGAQMTDFREKLKEIRATELERQRQRVPLTDHELGLESPAAHHLEVRGQLVKELERMLGDFIAEAPTFEIGHGFFEGKYALSMACDEPTLEEGRGIRKHFSRINFLLDPCGNDGSFSISVKIIVRDRDLPKAAEAGNLDRPEDVDRLRRFAEEQMLRFATEYFASRAPAAPTAPPAHSMN